MDQTRFRIDCAYDGRPFDGWQSQPGGNTVQDHLLSAVQGICPAVATVQGSGRTDAGVCADAQTAHFDVPADWKMDQTAWLKALNAKLPRTIRINRCALVDNEFHARFSATGKIYRYRIYSGAVLPPLSVGIAWHRRQLDVEAFVEAMQLFSGTHHFRAFAANRHDGKDQDRDTERSIFQITHSQPEPDWIEIDIHGSGFLYKMVRFMIGTGVYVSDGKLEAGQVEKWLTEPPKTVKAPYCAPPDGLSLKEVCYD